MENKIEEVTPKKNYFVFFFEEIFFNVRWVLNIFYLGLIAALCVYTYTYAIELIRLFRFANILNSDMMMLRILEMIDIVMVANLVKLIITGSYNSFVSKGHGYKNENVSSGTLKIKMATSIVGVSSIHLLRSFIDAKNMEWEEIKKQMAIHTILLVGAVFLAIIEFLHVKTELMESHHETH